MASECIDSFLVALKRTMVAICRVSRYKDGAFEAAVTTDSAVLDDLRTIISSPLLTTHEKSVFSQVKRAAINLRNMKARGEKPDDLRILNEGMCVMAMDDVVGTDCKARGQYKPPTMYQIIGADGEVEETVTIDHENKIEKYKGGKPMVVPGAPKSFNQAQTKAFGETFGDTFNLESKCTVGCYAPIRLLCNRWLCLLTDGQYSGCTP